MMQELPLDFAERTIFKLRSLYSRYGYTQYKMSKFEEYDLYAQNKDFLLSDSVITFTDTSGKLMALKPDMTLSIVKNSKDDPGIVQKVYYNENVYRVAKGSRSFKEIMQVGLECIGNIDDYCICEVLSLAAQSLRKISRESILEISHLGLLSDLIDSIGVPQGRKSAMLKYIGQKNIHELVDACRDCGVAEDKIEILKELIRTAGAPETVLPKIKALLSGVTDTTALEQLHRVVSALENNECKAMLRLDFSVVDDIHYYNGIVFKGFVQGLPGSVLTGGQYDKLMRKMYRKSGAIGFAVYTDLLERLESERKEYDVDTLVTYETGVSLSAIREQVKLLTQNGESVMVQQTVPENLRYRQHVNITLV